MNCKTCGGRGNVSDGETKYSPKVYRCIECGGSGKEPYPPIVEKSKPKSTTRD